MLRHATDPDQPMQCGVTPSLPHTQPTLARYALYITANRSRKLDTCHSQQASTASLSLLRQLRKAQRREWLAGERKPALSVSVDPACPSMG